jgi:hypothetical protein
MAISTPHRDSEREAKPSMTSSAGRNGINLFGHKLDDAGLDKGDVVK